MERKRITLAYLLAVLMFGCLGLLLRLISLPSDIVVLSRCILGSLFVLLLMKLRGHRMDKAAIRKNGKWLVISGACMGWNWLLLFAAYRYTTVAIASLCNYVAPILVIFAAAFLFREKLSRIKMLCVAGALAGIVLVLLQQRFGFVPMPGNFIVSAYPVVLKFTDILWTVLGVAGVGLLMALIPSRKLK